MSAWAPLALFVALVAGLIPLLHRDLERAQRRRRQLALAASRNHRVLWLADVKNPAAPTLAELDAAIDISCFVTDVTWNAAPSRSEILDDLAHASEVIRDRDYRAMLRGQRYVAMMHLDELLDDWCRSYGWEPTNVWRNERPFEKVQVRITVDDQFSHKVDAILYGLHGLQALFDAKSATVITDATS